MHINNTTKCILCFCTGLLLGGCLLYFGRSRDQSQRIAELERDATERECRLAELSERNHALTERLRDHNERARQLVESMGSQLGRDDVLISTTTELIRALRTQMQSIQDYYNYISSDNCGIIDMGDN